MDRSAERSIFCPLGACPPSAAASARSTLATLSRPTRPAAGGSFYWHRSNQHPANSCGPTNCRPTVVGTMVNIKLCSGSTTNITPMVCNYYQMIVLVLMLDVAHRLWVGYRQIHRTPQLCGVGLVGIGGVGAERRNTEVPVGKGPGPEPGISQRVCAANGGPKLPLGALQKFP